MASLKKLAGQTMWYGVSTIAGRLLTYIVTPYLLYQLQSPEGELEFGKQSYLYTLFPIMNVLFTYGMETSFFRFSKTEDKLKLYRTQFTMMILSTAVLTGIMLLFKDYIADQVSLSDHPEYIWWCAAIIALDTLSALPYAKLRQENRPRKYAFTKVAGIIVYAGTIVFLFSFGDNIADANPGSAFANWYHSHWAVGFIIFANLLQAILTLLLLTKELGEYRPMLDKELVRKILPYAIPILFAGFAGWMNEGLNRTMFKHLYPGTEKENLLLIGYYTAALRLAVVISLFIQAFKMAAEPFFFSISSDKNAPAAYARIMKWLVLMLALMFLNVVLFMDLWKYFIPAGNYREAMDVVPILMLSYIFIGIYYNLTVWYKLTDKTRYGTYIILVGSVVTVVFNWIFIPIWSFYACAWGTLLCNGVMMVLSYTWGQKHYPIPYQTGKLLGYLGIMLALFSIQWGISSVVTNVPVRLATGSVLFLAYIFVIYVREKQELRGLPLVGKFIK